MDRNAARARTLERIFAMAIAIAVALSIGGLIGYLLPVL
jgi:hypothetical protein